MRLRVLLAAALVALAPGAAAQTVLFPGMQGDDLRAALVSTYRPAVVPGEDAGKDRLYDTVERDTVGGVAGVVGLYSGHFVPFDCAPSCDPSQDVYNNGAGINLEHTWPQSEGADTGNAVRDLHHLFPTRVTVNGDRGSLPFGESPDAQTTRWYRGATAQPSAPPVATRDEWSELRSGVLFEPREEVKGDVARAMVYFYTMYGPGGTGQASASFFAEMRDVLLAWHRADPATPAERQRTWRAAGFQRTPSGAPQPNPFVLDSSLVRRAYFPSADPPPPVALDLRAWLAGPYAAGAMAPALAAAALVPDAQPYAAAAFDGTAMDHDGAEAVAPGFFAAHPDVVDWVLVELRPTPTGAPVARFAALIRADGTVVDTAGAAPIPLPDVPAGSYHAVLRHRNHRPATSALTAFPGGTTAVDLRTGGTGTVAVAPGVYALAPGDLDADGDVDAADAVAWRAANGAPPGYVPEDATLDGHVTAADLQEGVRFGE